jgi:type I thyroxine 5'-deiodinase
VYIKEAHPEDEWQMDSNEKENVCYPQPRTLAQRVAIANDFVKRFRYDVPIAIDDMTNRANELYAGWPERFYIVDESGKIAFKGKPGPFGFHPEEVEEWLKARFGPRNPTKESGEKAAEAERPGTRG